jgi:hypothetical protein
MNPVPKYANAADTKPAAAMRKLLRDGMSILPSCGRRRLFWQDAN